MKQSATILLRSAVPLSFFLLFPMMLLGIVLMVVGLLAVLVQAFKESTRWGLAVLLVPFAIVVFAIKHWVRSKHGVKIWVTGLAMYIIATPLVFAWGWKQPVPILLEVLIILVMSVGMSLELAGLISVLIQAFKESTRWGLAVLLVPFAIVVFAIKHWVRSKKGVKLWVIGLAIHVLAILVLESGRSVPPQRRWMRTRGLYGAGRERRVRL